MAPRPARAATGALAVAVAALLVLAAAAELDRPQASWTTAAADAAVAVALLLSAAVSSVPPVQRALLGMTGVSWALASLLPVPDLHRGVLVVTLLAFPSGGLPTPARRAVAVAAVPLAAGVLAPPAAAAVLLAAGLVRWPGATRGGQWFPPAAALLVGGTLATVWALGRWQVRVVDPDVALLAYQACLAVVAVGHVVAARQSRAERPRRVADALAVLATGTGAGTTALEAALAEAVGDPGLRLLDGAAATDARDALVVEEAGEVVAVVVSPAVVTADRSTQDEVRRAVRLGVRAARLQGEQERRLADLVAARARLVASADRQRAQLALRLREDVLPSLERALGRLAALPPGSGGAALEVVTDQLRGAADEMAAVVRGVPLVELGGGRLCAALRRLVEGVPLAVDLRCAEGASADAGAEDALFYACSEALTNVVKHAGARQVAVLLHAVDDRLVLSVRDDGRGGADACGGGLTGLADRLASRGGSLRVETGAGGTTVTASVPRAVSG